MHKGDIIHGDLTTSNMMIRPYLPIDKIFQSNSQNQLKLSVVDIAKDIDRASFYMIDFGLSSVSNKIEDKAVDIYVLKRAFISSHPGSENLFEMLLKNYQDIMCQENDKHKGLKIIAKFREVELRGRKRECFG